MHFAHFLCDRFITYSMRCSTNAEWKDVEECRYCRRSRLLFIINIEEFCYLKTFHFKILQDFRDFFATIFHFFHYLYFIHVIVKYLKYQISWHLCMRTYKQFINSLNNVCSIEFLRLCRHCNCFKLEISFHLNESNDLFSTILPLDFA